MKRASLLLLALAVGASSTGCRTALERAAWYRERVHVGMSGDEATRLLGEPRASRSVEHEGRPAVEWTYTFASSAGVGWANVGAVLGCLVVDLAILAVIVGGILIVACCCCSGGGGGPRFSGGGSDVSGIFFPCTRGIAPELRGPRPGFTLTLEQDRVVKIAP